TCQFVAGEGRVRWDLAAAGFWPDGSVVAADRKSTCRPGTLGSVTELLVRDGTPVAAGDPLFRLVAPGRSSWTTFYSSSALYDVVVSLQAMPSGRDLDAAAYLGGG